MRPSSLPRAPSRRRASRRRLPRAFYARPTLTVARELVGMVLVHRAPEGLTAGRIVEVEAYIGEDDPACHAAPGPTPRNAPLYGPPGFAYVYLNYGLHNLVNVVTERKGCPAAVLIRALEPIDGIELMQRRRARAGAPPHRRTPETICAGPGNLTVAMGITLGHNRLDLTGGVLTIEDRGLAATEVVWTPRIGLRVGVDRLWRAVDARARLR
jgi:DNA-3-methyladenine glycosylase